MPLGQHSPMMLNHSLRVGILSAFVARNEGGAEAMALYGGTGHDIGKLDVPADALHAAVFSESERELCRVHPHTGYTRLKGTYRATALIAGLHHSFKEDGYGIAPEENPLPEPLMDTIVHVAKLVAEVDFFDALTTRRNDKGLLSDLSDEKAVAKVLSQYFPGSVRSRHLLQNRIIHENETQKTRLAVVM